MSVPVCVPLIQCGNRFLFDQGPALPAGASWQILEHFCVAASIVFQTETINPRLTPKFSLQRFLPHKHVSKRCAECLIWVQIWANCVISKDGVKL